MPAYSVRFLVEFVAVADDRDVVITEITDTINGVYDVTSVAYGDLAITDPDAEPDLDEEDEEL